MIIDNPSFAYFFTTILLVIPVFVMARKLELLKGFSWSKCLRTLNKAILIQIPLGVFLFVLSWLIDSYFTGGVGLAMVLGVLLQSIYCYLVIGLFFYLPIIGLINFINFLFTKVFGNGDKEKQGSS